MKSKVEYPDEDIVEYNLFYGNASENDQRIV